ncbi:MAG: hypothetical protein IID13_00450 [Candidatus Marinimicrobia bacterium]|nr:hypothetical protein [Candidatus Neomarinimicrobiota bacterium]
MIKEYAFLISLVFIVLATMVGAFIRRRSRDKCLKDFSGNQVTLEQTGGKTIWGQLRIEHTGLELLYASAKTDGKGHTESSFILYKNEFPSMQALVRFHDDLSEADQLAREKVLQKTYQPGLYSRGKRRFVNLFKTIRDSLTEVINLLMSQAKKATPAGAVLSGQDKHVNQMKQELIGSAGTSYEPLLERYIGQHVVLELLKGDSREDLSGILKEYTAEFIEIMDVDYSTAEQPSPRKADLVVLRKYGVVRHLG